MPLIQLIDVALIMLHIEPEQLNVNAPFCKQYQTRSYFFCEIKKIALNALSCQLTIFNETLIKAHLKQHSNTKTIKDI
jgi:hypothetical protein